MGEAFRWGLVAEERGRGVSPHSNQRQQGVRRVPCPAEHPGSVVFEGNSRRRTMGEAFPISPSTPCKDSPTERCLLTTHSNLELYLAGSAYPQAIYNLICNLIDEIRQCTMCRLGSMIT